MKEDSPNVVQVSVEGEKTPPSLIRPDFDLVVVSAGYEQRLRFVKIYPPNRPIVLFETVDQSAHPIVP